jgi:glycosyltransferase involved in cell wall biosynthesis
MKETGTGARLSFVVICFNEEGYIEDCLRSIETAVAAAAGPDVPSVEVLIVDGMSTDDTVRRVRALAARSPLSGSVRVVTCRERGYSRQRNLGVRMAVYPWICFLSADVRLPADWLSATVRQLPAGPAIAVGGFDLVAPSGRSNWLASVTWTVYPTCSRSWVERCSSVHLLAHRDVLIANPFDESLQGCEDKDLAYRLQTCGHHVPAIRLAARPRHIAREGVRQFLGKLYRESRSLAALSRAHGPGFLDCFGWRHHARVSFGLLALVLFGVVLAGCPGWAVALGGGVWLVAGNWHGVGWSRRRASSACPLPLLAGLHLAAMMAIKAGYVVGSLGPFIRWARPPGLPRRN